MIYPGFTLNAVEDSIGDREKKKWKNKYENL